MPRICRISTGNLARPVSHDIGERLMGRLKGSRRIFSRFDNLALVRIPAAHRVCLLQVRPPGTQRPAPRDGLASMIFV